MALLLLAAGFPGVALHAHAATPVRQTVSPSTTTSSAVPDVERWTTLPAPPRVAMSRHGHVENRGASLYYATTGKGPPVLLLHGSLGSSDDWGFQVGALAAHHTVIVMDSRGQGRSTHDARPFSYDLMADDVVALLDALKIHRVDVVGWSDGANIGLDLAMRYPGRIGKLFAFGANASVSGMSGDPENQPIFPQVMARMAAEYARLSPPPQAFDAVAAQMGRLWAAEPDWSDAQLGKIRTPVWIVDGDHEEFIKRAHTEHIAATIPGAGLMILPDVSHLAPWQAPA
ncbi:MAG: alpha/beta fold hydrolase, partial [Proteobacteria bacterium]|nr:alpha/beta fold hydrolase [Pseudomonadota bacterium]